MRRTLVILAAVLLLGGFAYIDRQPDLARQVLAWSPHWPAHAARHWQGAATANVTANKGAFPMASWVVSGAGTTPVNGTYTENGADGGKPKYDFLNTVTYQLRWSGTAWNIAYIGMVFYINDGSDLPGTGWAKVSGDDPAPTISAPAGHPAMRRFGAVPGCGIYHRVDYIR